MKNKLNNISFYRLVATILILVYHFFFLLEPYAIPYITLLSKCVQGLTMLSGMLYANKVIKDIKGFYKKNIIKIIIPAGVCVLLICIWNLTAFLAGPYRYDHNYLNTFVSLRPYNQSFLIQMGNFWYVPMIIGCYLLTPLIQKGFSKRGINFPKVLVITAIVVELTVGMLFNSPNMIMSYVIGYLFGKKHLEEHVDPNSSNKLNRVFIYLTITILMFGIYMFTNESGYLNSGILPILYITRLINQVSATFFGMSTFLLFISIFINMNKYKKNPIVFRFSDKYSYSFYLFNQAFMVGAMNVAKFGSNLIHSCWIVFSFTLLFSILNTHISTPLVDLFFKKKKN